MRRGSSGKPVRRRARWEPTSSRRPHGGAVPPPPVEPERVAAVAGDGQCVDVVGGGAPGHRVGAAGVVADHPAERAPAVRGRVGAEGEAVGCGGGAQVVQDHARLDDGRPGRGVQFDDLPQVAGEVEDHTGAGGLPGDGGAAATRHDGDRMRTADGERGGDVVGVARGDDPERHPAVVGGVHRHQRPRGGAELHLSAHGTAEGPYKSGPVLSFSHGPRMPLVGALGPAAPSRFSRIRQSVGIRRMRSHIRNRKGHKDFPNRSSILI